MLMYEMVYYQRRDLYTKVAARYANGCPRTNRCLKCRSVRRIWGSSNCNKQEMSSQKGCVNELSRNEQEVLQYVSISNQECVVFSQLGVDFQRVALLFY